MLVGSIDFIGAPIIQNIVVILGFLTVVLALAQDKSVTIPILDLIQTFLCWPTILEDVHAAFCLWCFRQIERMFGWKGFLIFLLYNFITFLPTFLLTLLIKGFKGHFSLLFFVPFSLFIFMIWRIPATVYSGPLTDKFVVCLSFSFILILRFPFSILGLLSAIVGYNLWENDFFKFKRMNSLDSIELEYHSAHGIIQTRRTPRRNFSNSSEQLPLLQNDQVNEQNRTFPISQFNQSNNPRVQPAQSLPNDEELIEQIVSMGFSPGDARQALSRSRGDINMLIDTLLNDA